MVTFRDVDRLVAERVCTECGDTGLIPCIRFDGTEWARPCDLCFRGAVAETERFVASLSVCPECQGDGTQSCGPSSHEDCEWCDGRGEVVPDVLSLWHSWKEA